MRPIASSWTTTRSPAWSRRWNGWRRPRGIAGWRPDDPWRREPRDKTGPLAYRTCAAPGAENAGAGVRRSATRWARDQPRHGTSVHGVPRSLLTGKNGVLQLLGDARLDDGLGGDLD